MIFNIGGAAPGFLPVFTGSHALFGNGRKGYIEIYGSGELTFGGKKVVDVFLLGGGKPGGNGTANAEGNRGLGGDGGAGAAGQSRYRLELNGEYTVTVGASGGTTSAFGLAQSAGGGASGGAGSPGYAAAGNGATGVALPFAGDDAVFALTLGGGGGGGGGSRTNGNQSFDGGSGGSVGGGNGGNVSLASQIAYAGKPGTANTGGGGGGGGATPHTYTSKNGGSGGSGLVIVRWGY